MKVPIANPANLGSCRDHSVRTLWYQSVQLWSINFDDVSRHITTDKLARLLISALALPLPAAVILHVHRKRSTKRTHMFSTRVTHACTRSGRLRRHGADNLDPFACGGQSGRRDGGSEP